MLANIKLLRSLGSRFFFRVNAVRRLGQDTTKGFYQTLVITTLFNIGLFEALENQTSLNLERFASENDLDLDVLTILCDYLFSRGILDRQGANYGLSPDGKLIAEFLEGTFQIIYAYSDIFFSLEDLLNKKKRYGKDIIRRSEFVARGSGSVGKLLAFPLMASLVSKNGFSKVLDIGCGDASFLIDLCERNPQINGYGLDIAPEAITAAKVNLVKRNLEDKIQLHVADMFKINEMAKEIPDIEVATCVYVLHELLRHNRTETLQMLQKFRESFPGVPLLVCEVIRHSPETLRQKPGGVIEIQLFHGLSNQQIFSREEWRSFFKQAGFENVKEDYFGSVRTAIFTVS